MKKGFKLEKNGPTIYYLDCLGKDAAFERWRIDAYYKRNFAQVLFFNNETDYKHFIETHQNKVYKNYDELIDLNEVEELQDLLNSTAWANDAAGVLINHAIQLCTDAGATIDEAMSYLATINSKRKTHHD